MKPPCNGARKNGTIAPVKVLFLVSKLETPSTRWRVLQLLPHLQKAGVECAVEELPAGMLGKLTTARRGTEFDVVVLQNRLLPKLINARVRKFAKRLVFEFDDAVTLKKTKEGVRASKTRERRFRRVVEASDAVITTNEVLAEQARRVARDPKNVVVLPSAIDVARWPGRGPSVGGQAPVIGWAGSANILQHLEIVRPPLARLCRRHAGLKLRIVCEDGIELDGVATEHRAFSATREVDDVQSFDIAIAPQVEDVWTRPKMSAKILAYFAAGVPTVASNVTSHRLYVRDGENGFLAGTLTDWEEKLERLIEDPALRDKIGLAGRATAEREFSIGAVVPKYLELFKRLLKGPAVAT
ncbi:MAG: glycosyltransferase family 4 protein [Planctomycetes bacterium]|nr:glycosyltransferase family 4 protein [Planctomycetota bacterium]